MRLITPWCHYQLRWLILMKFDLLSCVSKYLLKAALKALEQLSPILWYCLYCWLGTCNNICNIPTKIVIIFVAAFSVIFINRKPSLNYQSNWIANLVTVKVPSKTLVVFPSSKWTINLRVGCEWKIIEVNNKDTYL